MRQHVCFLFLISVVLASGCTTGTGDVVSGLVITEFRSDVTQAYSGEPVGFFLKVKNMGSFAADGAAKMDLSGWGGDCRTGIEKDFSNLVAPSEERGTTGEEISFT